MKAYYLLLVFVSLIFISSCNSIKISSDYDENIDFTKYKTYAFYKNGIDKVEISDLDKKKILYAIEREMAAKGFEKSDKPDLLVNIFAKSKERIDVYNNYYNGWYPWYYGWGYGYGYGFGYGPGYTNVVQSTEGTLFIDLIDANSKELVWQGMGTGILGDYRDKEKKEERINEYVNNILTQYPPMILKPEITAK
jgi:hypothetical protein